MGLLDRLNPPQRIAAEATEGPVVILAGAGSGKTSAITARCANIIETCGVPASEVCLMTFTNKAADEMRERIQGMLSKEKVRGLWAGTFHSLCGRILRKYPLLVNRRADFAIYDDDDQKVLVKQALDEMMTASEREDWNPDIVREEIGAKKQVGLTPDEMILESPKDARFKEIWETYERMLVSYNAMDFEDMILLACQLLRRDDEIGHSLRTKFRYVMVDEFQDTNKTQWELVQLLASNRNLCVVGDDDQCAKIGSMIMVAGNSVPVEALETGTSVTSWSPTDDAWPHRGTVTGVSARPYDGPMYDVYAGGRCLSVTSEHRFAVREKDSVQVIPYLVQAWELQADEMMLPVLSGPTSVGWQPISAVRRHHYEGPVYSLKIEPEPYFIANGIVTHNSIYGWRGADVKIIRGFKEAYPDAVVVKLEQNYRSTKRIVAAAHSVIVKGRDRLDKALWTANDEGPKVTVNEAVDDRDEARFVVDQMRRLIKAEHTPEGMALLYRSHAQSRLFEDELIANRIAYRLIGGFGFYDRKEIKGLLSYMRLVVNPDSDVDTIRVINLPHRGVGAGTVKRLREMGRSRKTSIWGAMATADQLAEVRPRERDAVKGFRQKVERLRALADDVPRPSEFAAFLVQETGVRKMYLDEQEEHLRMGDRKKAEEAADRAENCTSLIEAIGSYERKCADQDEPASLRGYLEMVALVTKAKEATEKEQQKVTLMTVHAAKGLEFDYVWIVAMEEGRFPSGRSIGHLDQEEEERRLAYVAITRARRQLWVTYASQRMVYGQLVPCTASRFTEDMIAIDEAVKHMSTDEYRELQRQALGE